MKLDGKARTDIRKVMLKNIYQDASDDIPVNAPLSRDKNIQINCYVDADHAIEHLY